MVRRAKNRRGPAPGESIGLKESAALPGSRKRGEGEKNESLVRSS